MTKKINSFHLSFIFPIISVIILLFPLNNVAYSMEESSIYDDPNIVTIYHQHSILNAQRLSVQESLKNFDQMSAYKQQDFLQNFKLVQNQLEQEYKNRKSILTNKRLARYGFTTTICLFTPMLLIMCLNAVLSEENKIGFGSLPFIVFQGSTFFMFKFLELFSQKFVASREGAIQQYEIQYVRNKAFYDQGFCKVFEGKLIAVHKNPANLYEALKWFHAANRLPITKMPISMDTFNQNFEREFSIFPSNIREKVRVLCLRHILQKHTRVIAYFHGFSGTGKSRCVRAIARCLEVPFSSVALANYSVSDLIGQGGNNMPSLGKLAEAILNAQDKNNEPCQPSTNMVLQITEADKVLNEEENLGSNKGLLPFVLDLLDPEKDSFYCPYFEKNIRIREKLIILDGNNVIKNEALSKRLYDIEFTGFSTSYKKQYILTKYIPELYSSTEQPYKLNIQEHFLVSDKEKIIRFIDKDQDPGLRSTQEYARQFVDEKMIEVFFKEKIY